MLYKENIVRLIIMSRLIIVFYSFPDYISAVNEHLKTKSFFLNHSPAQTPPGPSLEIKCNLKTVNYLDITLDLNTGTYKPYRKPNDEILYIHAKSNHPANILKQLPISIETRLSNISSNSEIFHEASKHY